MLAGKSGLRRDLRHGAGHLPDSRVELDARVAGGVPLLLVPPRRPKLPSATAMIPVLSEKTDRSLCTVDTTLSQDGPLLPLGADVGPVPVWKSPNSPE